MDPRAAVALARLLQVVLTLDADQLGDLVSIAEEMTGAGAPEAEPAITDALPELVTDAPAPAPDPAEEARLVVAAQRRLEENRQQAGLTAQGLRPASRSPSARGGHLQLLRGPTQQALARAAYRVPR